MGGRHAVGAILKKQGLAFHRTRLYPERPSLATVPSGVGNSSFDPRASRSHRSAAARVGRLDVDRRVMITRAITRPESRVKRLRDSRPKVGQTVRPAVARDAREEPRRDLALAQTLAIPWPTNANARELPRGRSPFTSGSVAFHRTQEVEGT